MRTIGSPKTSLLARKFIRRNAASFTCCTSKLSLSTIKPSGELFTIVSEKLSALETVTGTATHFILKKYKDHGTILGKKKEDTREIVTP